MNIQIIKIITAGIIFGSTLIVTAMCIGMEYHYKKSDRRQRDLEAGIEATFLTTLWYSIPSMLIGLGWLIKLLYDIR